MYLSSTTTKLWQDKSVLRDIYHIRKIFFLEQDIQFKMAHCDAYFSLRKKISFVTMRRMQKVIECDYLLTYTPERTVFFRSIKEVLNIKEG